MRRRCGQGGRGRVSCVRYVTDSEKDTLGGDEQIFAFSSHIRGLAGMALILRPPSASRFHRWSLGLMRLGGIGSGSRFSRDPWYQVTGGNGS